MKFGYFANVSNPRLEKPFSQILEEIRDLSENIEDAGIKLCKLLESDSRRLRMRESLAALNSENGAETLADLCALNIA